MIYISSDIEVKNIQIPVNLSRNDTGMYKFILFNTTTRQEYEYEVRDSEFNVQYYNIEFTPISMPEGEYEYTLKDDDQIYSKGLLRYGDYSVDVKSGDEKISGYKYSRDI